MKLTFDEIVELIHREMYVRNGVMLGEKAAAKAIMQAEEAAQQTFAPDVCHSTADGRHLWQNDVNGRYCFACGTRR